MKVTKRKGVSKVYSTSDLKKREDSLAKSDLVKKTCNCGRVVERVKRDAEWVICWECVARACPPPIVKVKEVKVDDGFITGWRWMKQFVHRDGRVFEKGIENEKLKNTLDPTPPKEKKKRLSRFEREEKEKLKQEKLAKKYKKKQEVLKKKEKKLAKNIKPNKFWEAS